MMIVTNWGMGCNGKNIFYFTEDGEGQIADFGLRIADCGLRIERGHPAESLAGAFSVHPDWLE